VKEKNLMYHLLNKKLNMNYYELRKEVKQLKKTFHKENVFKNDF